MTPRATAAVRCMLAVATCVCGPIATSSIVESAGQLRSVTDGVYAAGQAARGQDIYRTQCAECHGKAMEGAVGPPLAGDSFLANWSTRSLTNLVDKIQKTMPFNLPATLSRREATDLAAYI